MVRIKPFPNPPRPLQISEGGTLMQGGTSCYDGVIYSSGWGDSVPGRRQKYV